MSRPIAGFITPVITALYRRTQQFISKELEQRAAFFGLQIVTTAVHFHAVANHLRQDDLAHGTAGFVDDGA